jgi:hypothetical protein
MTEHPVVVVDHPIASKSKVQIQELAQSKVDEVVHCLLSSAHFSGHSPGSGRAKEDDLG